MAKKTAKKATKKVAPVKAAPVEAGPPGKGEDTEPTSHELRMAHVPAS